MGRGRGSPSAGEGDGFQKGAKSRRAGGAARGGGGGEAARAPQRLQSRVGGLLGFSFWEIAWSLNHEAWGEEKGLQNCEKLGELEPPRIRIRSRGEQRKGDWLDPSAARRQSRLCPDHCAPGFLLLLNPPAAAATTKTGRTRKQN